MNAQKEFNVIFRCELLILIMESNGALHEHFHWTYDINGLFYNRNGGKCHTISRKFGLNRHQARKYLNRRYAVK